MQSVGLHGFNSSAETVRLLNCKKVQLKVKIMQHPNHCQIEEPHQKFLKSNKQILQVL